MIALGKNFNKGPVSLGKIAKEKKMPFKFLEQVVISLRGAGLIEAKEGKGGGYFLTRPPKRISVAEVVEALEGPLEVGLCFDCPKVKVCGQKDVWGEVGDKIRKTIEGKTLADLI
jgi:Rrf2 family protein